MRTHSAQSESSVDDDKPAEVAGVKKVILIVMDGWGKNHGVKGSDATFLAKTPNLDILEKEYPHTELSSSGLSVGLPEGQMGNSEVGHLTLGAGRVISQDLTMIDKAIRIGDFYNNKIIRHTISDVKRRGSSLHLMGLLSDGGVHSHISHLFALLEMVAGQSLDEVYIHAFMDGRDTPPKSGKGFIVELKEFIHNNNVGSIATVSGRFYAMDRDCRWERTEKAFRAIAYADGIRSHDPVSAVEDAYLRGESDEFITPTVLYDAKKSVSGIKNGDSIIFFNFRADRARELTRAFIDSKFYFFDVGRRPEIGSFVTFTQYDITFNLPVVFPPQPLNNILPSVLSNEGFQQFRIAETEKYAHVTFFFNGGVEEPLAGEERLLIRSPRDVATYDLKPEMSAFKVTDALIDRINKDKDQFILVNYANGDMVGHTGILSSAIKACEAVDISIGRVVTSAMKRGWTILITSDHGNAEEMTDPETGLPHTAHMSNAVPFILVDDDFKNISLRDGTISDVAPTILDIMGIRKPKEMSGDSLIIY